VKAEHYQNCLKTRDK